LILMIADCHFITPFRFIATAGFRHIIDTPLATRCCHY
jgi:hypothetical protein